ncbi:MAG: hypothetical protein AB1724_08660 [Thermodesulfobacteriota bacterium]
MMKKWMLCFIVLVFITGQALAAEKTTTGTPEAASAQTTTIEEVPEVTDTTGKSADKTAPAEPTDKTATAGGKTSEVKKHGFGHKLLLYIPNRILDVFDFVRLRVRVGPGIAVGVRATKPLTLAVGGYTSIYAGLPGPRREPTINLPIGIENYVGAELSVLDGSNEGRFSPNYSSTEIGVSVHPLIVGLDLAVDPLEVLDLALGFLFIDLCGDDF